MAQGYPGMCSRVFEGNNDGDIYLFSPFTFALKDTVTVAVSVKKILFIIEIFL